MRDRVKGFTPNRVESKRKFNGGLEKDRMYKSKRWQNYRKKYLAINRVCYCCGNPATVIDHIEPHRGDAKLFWKIDNFLPLCAPCHSRVTMLYDVPGKSSRDKIEHMNWTRAKHEVRERPKVVPFDPSTTDQPE